MVTVFVIIKILKKPPDSESASLGKLPGASFRDPFAEEDFTF